MECVRLDSVTLYRFESEYLGTNMYVLISGKEALIVDPHPSHQAANLFKENGINKATVFLTHEHPDHTYGLPGLKEIMDFKLVCHRKCAETIAVEKNNRPLLMTFVLEQKDDENGTDLAQKFAREFRPYAFRADTVFDENFQFNWNGIEFLMTSTPGHSKGSCCIQMKDLAVFTGDSLILNTPVITRFPGGSLQVYNEKTKPYLDALPDETLVLPGHGPVFKMKEARTCGI